MVFLLTNGSAKYETRCINPVASPGLYFLEAQIKKLLFTD